MDNQDCIGLVIEVPNIGRGQIRYIGSVETKKGTFVGINLFAGNGKNDGTFRGRRYFETSFPQSGLFIQWEKIDSSFYDGHIKHTSIELNKPNSSNLLR